MVDGAELVRGARYRRLPAARRLLQPCWLPVRELLPCEFHSGEWRNRQTRWLQVPVFERMWGFKSPLAHE